MLFDNYDCGDMSLRKDYFWFYDIEGWGVYYAPDCIAAIEVFELFADAWAFAKNLS